MAKPSKSVDLHDIPGFNIEGCDHIDIFMFLLKRVIVTVSQNPFSSYAAVNIFKPTIVSYLVIIALVRFLIISLKCLDT